MKVKSDHRSKFSNLSNWKEGAFDPGLTVTVNLIFYSEGAQYL